MNLMVGEGCLRPMGECDRTQALSLVVSHYRPRQSADTECTSGPGNQPGIPTTLPMGRDVAW